MEWLVIVLAVNGTMSVFGYWVARQKRRDPGEGLALGLLFGPVGVLVEALLPVGDRMPSANGQTRRTLDDECLVAMVADRFRTALDEHSTDWQRLPARQVRAITSRVEGELARELGLSATRMAEVGAEARRLAVRLSAAQ